MKLPIKLSRSRSRSNSPPSTSPSSPAAFNLSPTTSQKNLLTANLRIPFSPRRSPKHNPACEIVEVISSPLAPQNQLITPILSPKRQATEKSPLMLKRVPSSVMREITQAFAQFDANGDGKISAEELRAVMRSLGDEPTKEEAELMVGEVDADGDGFIDLQEFVDLNTRCLHVTGEMASHEELAAAFEIFDLDKNGRITAEELQEVLSRLGGAVQRTSFEDCKRMIRGVDRKGLGHVDFDDFKSMMNHLTPLS